MNFKGNLTNISLPLKSLFTSYLILVGIGYVMAFTQILLTHGMADGEFGLSTQDIVYSYYGDRTGTVLENKLKGSMAENASQQDRTKIIEWVRNGAEEKTYNSNGIREIFQDNCIMCHAAESGLGNFNVFADIKERAKIDEGASVQSLTRISHIHLFGIAFIFFFVCLIFCFARSVPNHYKAMIIAVPYLSQVLDIASWWFTKWLPEFAIVVIIGGVGMVLAFSIMWIVSMYEMWLAKPGLDQSGE